MTKSHYGRLFSCLAILASMQSCQTQKADSEVKLDTSNAAGIPRLNTPPADRSAVDHSFNETDDLKVLNIKTAERTIAQVADSLGPDTRFETNGIGFIRAEEVDARACKMIQANGPHIASVVDCTNLIEITINNHFGLEGIAIQNWSTRGRGGVSWQLTTCKPSTITLQISRKKLAESKLGIGFYVALQAGGQMKNSDIRNVSAVEIESRGRVKGEFVEADFLLLGKCGDVTVEFKPFFNNKEEHYWPSYKNQIIN